MRHRSLKYFLQKSLTSDTLGAQEYPHHQKQLLGHTSMRNTAIKLR